MPRHSSTKRQRYQLGLRALRYSASVDALLRLVAGISGDTSYGTYTTARVLMEALRPVALRDPRFARLSALLACSMGDDPDPPVPPAVIGWCLRTLRGEMARSDRILRRLAVVPG